MTQLLLADDQKLKAACAVSLEKAARAGNLERSSADIAAFTKKFRAASGKERASLEFQRWLWDAQP